jgi:tetratricopeptide (TPR) repeat protein
MPNQFSGNLIPLLIFSILSEMCRCQDVFGQSAMIEEKTQSILTYPFSDPNPVPTMAINAMVTPFYPYFVFDGYSDKAVPKDWTVIKLENNYIELSVLPGVGGKVWGAREKSTGREFIYQNHVLKFRAIGIRGPWTSGGIEHNFGLDLGHAPWTASAVDYVTKENADGSVSCIVGGLDLPSRTQWRVNIRLPGDKACFETQSMWYNPTPLHDAYLSWENAGFKATDDLQFYFPGTYYIGHDGAVSPWPIDAKGRNLSVYKENNFGSSKSYHVSGLFTNWFGGYWHGADFGFCHFAPYSDAPGKKIWIWSLAREGAIWENLLTDHDGQYIEAQSGVKFNQANRESGFNSPFNQLSLRPFYTETKTEDWFPVKNTKGMVDASPAGTMNVIISGDSLRICISPNSMINDSLKVNLSGKPLFSSFIRLVPMQVYQEAIALPCSGIDEISVVVGNNLLSYSSDQQEYQTDRPAKSETNQDFNSAEHLFRMAEDENAMRNYNEAMGYYLACLQQAPTHSRALTKTAELHYRRGEYAEGLSFARQVLENDTYDAGANFISGVIQRRMGNLVQSEEEFSIAARTMEYRSGSYLQIAGINMIRQDFNTALAYAKKALDYNRFNITAHAYLATGYRKLGMFQESSRTLDELLEIDPLNHYARFEQYLLNREQANLQIFNSCIRNELPYETYLELALEYANQGLEDEAIQVLEQSPPYPTVFYWLAYLYRKSSTEKSNRYLKQAEEMSPYLVFPFRLETIPVLTWASEQHDCWKTTYYLGLIYWHLLRKEKAMELFEQCGDVPDYAPFYLARAILFQNQESEYCLSCNDFLQAVRLNPNEWRTWHYFNTFLQTRGAFQQQLMNAKQAYHQFSDNPVIGIDFSKALLNAHLFKECVKTLGIVNILPQEGAHEGHDIYESANLGLAVERLEQKKYRDAVRYLNESRKWPENLGAGKPYEPDTRFQDYVSAYCYARLGNRKMADSCLDQIIHYSLDHWGNAQEPTNTYIALRVFNDQGRHPEVIRAMSKWKAEQDSLRNWRISEGSGSPKVQWVFAGYNHEEERKSELEKEIALNRTENRFRLFLKTMTIINPKENEK